MFYNKYISLTFRGVKFKHIYLYIYINIFKFLTNFKLILYIKFKVKVNVTIVYNYTISTVPSAPSIFFLFSKNNHDMGIDIKQRPIIALFFREGCI